MDKEISFDKIEVKFELLARKGENVPELVIDIIVCNEVEIESFYRHNLIFTPNLILKMIEEKRNQIIKRFKRDVINDKEKWINYNKMLQESVEFDCSNSIVIFEQSNIGNFKIEEIDRRLDKIYSLYIATVGRCLDKIYSLYYEIDKNKYFIEIKVKNDENFPADTKADCELIVTVDDVSLTYVIRAYPFLSDRYPREITSEDWENIEKSAIPVIAKIRLFLIGKLKEGKILDGLELIRFCHDLKQEEIDSLIHLKLGEYAKYYYNEKFDPKACPETGFRYTCGDIVYKTLE
jgi:hypothetical protein